MSFLIRSSRSATTNFSNTVRLTTKATKITATHHFTRAFQSTAINMGVHNLANKAEFDAALKDNKIVVLDAFATWCGPCKVIAPQVVKFSDEFTSAHFVKLDVDDVPEVAQELGIRAMPTFLIFKNAEKVSEIVGANPKALLAAIESAVKGDVAEKTDE